MRMTPDKAVPNLAQRERESQLQVVAAVSETGDWMTLADMAWFHENVDVWPLGAGFQTFKEFVDGMVMANDPAARHIHQIQQCINISY